LKHATKTTQKALVDSRASRSTLSIAKVLATAGAFAALTCGSAAVQAADAGNGATAATVDPAQFAELIKQVQVLAAQNKALQEKVEKLEAAQRVAASPAPAPAPQASVAWTPGSAPAAPVEQAKAEPDTVVSSYGEIAYSRPTKAPEATNVDLARAVIGLSHRFNEKTKMAAEFEWEHAVTSASDSGEAEVEQLWVEREFDSGARGRVGLFLMPVGLINQNHEPTAYYGVFRPDVDTKIIPSTWREAGVGLTGTTDYGLSWDVALTTAPNLSKWDPTSPEGAARGPLQAIHGEAQFAAANTLGTVGALNWRGVPGLLVGGSVVYDNIGQNQPGFLANGSKLLLWDVHSRYQAGKWDLAGVLVRGTISNTEAVNASFAASAPPAPTLVPQLFYGGYVQAAYKLWQHEDLRLTPFVRYEVYNTAAGFGSLPVGLGGITQPTEHLTTIGASFYVTDSVVLKADYRHYQVNQLPDPVNHFNVGNSLNLGMGYSF